MLYERTKNELYITIVRNEKGVAKKNILLRTEALALLECYIRVQKKNILSLNKPAFLAVRRQRVERGECVYAWRLTLRARGVRVGVGLRGIGLGGLGWRLGPGRWPILWHVPGIPRAPRPAPRSPASTRRGPVAPWSGRRRPTCDHQPHKTRVTDRNVTRHFTFLSVYFSLLAYICIFISLLLVFLYTRYTKTKTEKYGLLKCFYLNGVGEKSMSPRQFETFMLGSLNKWHERNEIRKKRWIMMMMDDDDIFALAIMLKNFWHPTRDYLLIITAQ